MAKASDPVADTIAEIKNIKENKLKGVDVKHEDSAWILAALLVVAERLGGGGATK